MASPASSPAIFAVEAITLLAQGNIQCYCYITVTALVVYEHIVTLDREVLAIWRYRMTGVTVLLLLNRYVLLLTAVVDVIQTLNWSSDQSCYAQEVLHDVAYVLPITITAGFSALRVYAIARQNWFWTLLTLMTGLVPVATNTYSFTANGRPYGVMVASVPTCTANTSLPEGVFNSLLIVTRICAIVSDSVVIAATWLYALPWAKHIPDTGSRPPLMFIILRDGTGYFIALLLLNTSQIVTEHLIYSAGLDSGNYMSLFLSPIASILISRFMLNLRQHIDEGNSTGSNFLSFVNENTRSGGSIHFGNRLVGNMGAPLDHSISNSLLFDDGGELGSDHAGCNEEFIVESTLRDAQGHEEYENAGEDVENVGIIVTS